MEIERWDVFLVNLDPTIGKEINKLRPAVIVSPDEVNQFWSPVVIVPMTSKLRNVDFRTKISFQGVSGQAAIDQIRAVDKQRLVKKLGKLSLPYQRKILADILIFFQQ